METGLTNKDTDLLFVSSLDGSKTSNKTWPKLPNLTVFPEILSILKLVVFTTASSSRHIALPYGVTALHTAS